MRLRRPSRRAGVLLLVVFVLGLAVIGPSVYVRVTTSEARYAAADVPAAPVAIVLGAGIRGDQPSPFLQRRLDLAIELYAAGRVRGLLMTGDNSTADHDEVAVMANYAIANGVPAEVVAKDHAGFDTYDSCYRAREVFGVRRAIVVTQSFHLARAVYTCRQLGVAAVGVGDDSSERWPMPTRRSQLREVFSTAKAVWETKVSRPEPHFLGPHEPALDAVLGR